VGVVGDVRDGDAVVLLDGGLATRLEARGHDLSDDLWSARLLADDPGEIVAAHLDFFRAGAQVATSASYQASVGGFAARGYDKAEAERLIMRSVELARVAADTYEAEQPAAGPLLVAASIGPYGAVLADGSEYSGDYGVSDDVLRDFHTARLELLLAAEPDLLALETVPSEQEAAVLLEVLVELRPPVPAWLSLTCADGSHTRRGEDARGVFSLATGHPGVVAVGVNCTAPEYVAELVAAAVDVTGKPAVAYPNSGEAWDAVGRRWVRGPDEVGVDPAVAVGWVESGVRFVGGCCRVTPDDIAALAAAITRSR
jgi:homocysteine S-methyltransferase